MKQIDSISNYKKHIKRKKTIILLTQIGLGVAFVFLWELLAHLNIINVFLVSKPSAIFELLIKYVKRGTLFNYVFVSVYETLLGLIIGTIVGLIIGVILWWNNNLAKVLDPFLVVLNALPKTALAPILIIWAGTGIKGIVLVAISLSIVVTIMSAYNYFSSVDKEQIKMMKTMGASKFQILTKLVLPSNIPNILNIVKINIGMSWVGVIVGEFLVSREGIGYLVVYGGQVFKLDLVMMGVFILGVIALLMYLLLNTIEKYYRYSKYKAHK